MNPLNEMNSMEQMLCSQAAQKKIPINGSIEITPLCNMNCDMCYVKLTPEEMHHQGRLRTVEEWLDIAEQMRSEGVLFLLITGGEPLSYPKFKELYMKLKEMGFIISINTNGTLIDEAWVDFFAKEKPRRLNITLYGSSKETYDQLCHYPEGFDRVMNALLLLKQHKIDVRLGCSIASHNANEWKDIWDIGMSLDMPLIVDTYMYPASRERTQAFSIQSRISPEESAKISLEVHRKKIGDQRFDQFVKEQLWFIDNVIIEETEAPSGMGCMAGNCSFTINWQGNMRPCVVMSSPESNVFEIGFAQSWKNLVEPTSKIIGNPHCRVCNLQRICQTCPACAMLEESYYDKIPAYACKRAHAREKIMRQWLIDHTLNCTTEKSNE